MGIIDQCNHCGESTAFGSGRFVNRVPAESTEKYPDSEWCCYECDQLTTDECDLEG
jgi:hypothetical protein